MQKRDEAYFMNLLKIVESTPGLYYSYETDITLKYVHLPFGVPLHLSSSLIIMSCLSFWLSSLGSDICYLHYSLFYKFDDVYQLAEKIQVG